MPPTFYFALGARARPHDTHYPGPGAAAKTLRVSCANIGDLLRDRADIAADQRRRTPTATPKLNQKGKNDDHAHGHV
jgi:hypothetical protein